jgi:Spy/CpxP family protein refolding chaperone
VEYTRKRYSTAQNLTPEVEAKMNKLLEESMQEVNQPKSAPPDSRLSSRRLRQQQRQQQSQSQQQHLQQYLQMIFRPNPLRAAIRHQNKQILHLQRVKQARATLNKKKLAHA